MSDSESEAPGNNDDADAGSSDGSEANDDAGSVPDLFDESDDDISLVSSESRSDSEGDVDWALINRTAVIRVDSSDSDDEQPITKNTEMCPSAGHIGDPRSELDIEVPA